MTRRRQTDRQADKGRQTHAQVTSERDEEGQTERDVRVEQATGEDFSLGLGFWVRDRFGARDNVGRGRKYEKTAGTSKSVK